MNRILGFCATAAVVIVAGITSNTARAEDASVDQLIKKLPPPEKVVQADPASRDPLAKQIIDAIKRMNFGNAYAMSQKLAARYPKSAGAHSLHGQLALVMRHYPEASDAFHKAISIQPNFGTWDLVIWHLPTVAWLWPGRMSCRFTRVP